MQCEERSPCEIASQMTIPAARGVSSVPYPNSGGAMRRWRSEGDLVVLDGDLAEPPSKRQRHRSAPPSKRRCSSTK